MNPCIYMHGACGAEDRGRCAVLLDIFAEGVILHNGFEPVNCVFSKLLSDSGPVNSVFSEASRAPDQEIQPLELLPKGLRSGKYRCFRSFRIFRIFRYFRRSRRPATPEHSNTPSPEGNFCIDIAFIQSGAGTPSLQGGIPPRSWM